MIKQLFRSLVLTSIMISMGSLASQQSSITPANTVFAFDLHGVIFKINKSEIAKQAVKLLFKPSLLKMAFYCSFWEDIKILKAQHASSEQYLDTLIKKYPELANHKSFGMNLINAQKKNPGTIEVLKALKKQGYKIYLISNVGPKSLKTLQKRHPEVFNLFEGYSIPTKENNYLRKPNKRVFEHFIKKNNLESKNIIFVDDKEKHLKSARRVGIKDTIHFTSSSDLEKRLSALIKKGQ